MSSPVFKLGPYLKPHWKTIAVSMSLAIPLSALRAMPVPLVQRMIDEVLPSHEPRKLIYIPAGLILIAFANFFVRFFHYYLLKRVITQVNLAVKNDLYAHILGLSADYFTEKSTGTLMSRVGADTQYIDGGLASLNTIVREPITFLFLFGYAFNLNWRLTLVTFAIFPPLIWIFAVTARNLKRYIQRLTEENARVYSTMQESFTGIRVIKAFQLEAYVRRHFRERSNQFARFLLKAAALEEAAHPLVEFLTFLAIAAVVYIGGAQVFAGQMKAGDLFAFFLAFGLMMNPLRMVNDVNIKYHQTATACARIFEIFEWKSRLHQSKAPIRISEFYEGVSFDRVDFAYPDSPDRAVLKQVSFTMKRGQVVALVGASGAGKTSVVNLLPRIFDVTGGGIFIDAVDIRELALPDLRKLVALVSQDVFLFNDTIYENIRCGRLDATEAEIHIAARKAHATDFIERLPQGYETVIGDRGQKLSGGERQRVSIARAFLREAPILVLDEATSSLDTASERAVQDALDELMANRTTLIIAHRLSTVRRCDRILVMKDGRVVESGRHDELLAARGEYARFHAAGGLGAVG